MLTMLSLRKVHRQMLHTKAARTNSDLESALSPAFLAPQAASSLKSNMLVTNIIFTTVINHSCTYHLPDPAYLQK